MLLGRDAIWLVGGVLIPSHAPINLVGRWCMRKGDEGEDHLQHTAYESSTVDRMMIH